MGKDNEIEAKGNTDGAAHAEADQEISKRKVKHKANLEFQTALDYLQQIVDTARDGNFVVETDGNSVNLTPGDAVDLEIKAKEKDGRQSLSFELSWGSEATLRAEGAKAIAEDIPGDVCLADRMRNMEAEAGDYDDLERRFELELFGGCGCVEVPSS
jgi:amphi-Trp domain-containing protein